MIEFECPLRNSAIKFPDEDALLQGELCFSYRELDRKVQALSHVLSDKGISRGMKVGIISENSIQYIILIFSLLRLDCFVVPINFRITYPEIEKIIKGIGIDAVLTDMFSEKLMRTGRKTIGIRDLFSSIPDGPEAREAVLLKNGGTVILTSGSTGSPKGALLTASNHYFSASGSNMNINLDPPDRWLLVLPLYHIGGFAVLYRVFLAGASVVLPAGENSHAFEEICSGRVTHVSMVHTQILELIDRFGEAGIRCPETLRVLLAGGSYIPDTIILKALDIGIPLYKTYGLTEMASQVTTTRNVLKKNNSSPSGSILEFRELMIGPDNEILVRGETLFRGYISENKFIPVKTDRYGWFKTGDLGYLNESGELCLTGRKDDMFISGGENVFPNEIEQELLKIKNISEAIVVPMDNEKYGKRPAAFVYSSGKQLSREFLIRELRKTLPGFKIPDRFFYLKERPPGEIKRRRGELKTVAEPGRELDEISD